MKLHITQISYYKQIQNCLKTYKTKKIAIRDFPESQTKAIPYFPSQVEWEGDRPGNSGASEIQILDVDWFN